MQLLLLSQIAFRAKEDSIQHERNLRVMVFMLCGTMYEICKGLQDLRNARVVEKMRNPAAWEPLDELCRRWQGDRILSKFRNQVSFHLGMVELYEKGLSAMLQEADDLVLDRLEGRLRHQSDYQCAWDAILRGLGLEESDLQKAMEVTLKGHTELPELLFAVFREVLKSAGIGIVDESSKTLPSVNSH